MSTQLGYSMFQDVLFPVMDQPAPGDAAEVLRLRRVKRFVPERDHALRTGALVVFDLETTGLDPDVDRIIEIGGIKLVGMRPVAEFSALVSVDLELTDDIVKLTGITQDMLTGQPPIDAVLPRFLEFIDGSVLVAHNAEFDMAMLKAAAGRGGLELEWPCLCTLKMARELLAGLENRKLDTLAAHYGLAVGVRHRAIGDIKVTVGVLEGLFGAEARALHLWSQLQPYTVA